MRQSQQKNRMRGRGGRKMPNPMSRNYESNGPDVKIRGNAAHVAEKYTSLARDAFASGDTVTGENYLQHAEHYNRIVAAAQAQAQPFRSDDQPSAGFGGQGGARGPQPDASYGDGDDDNETGGPLDQDGGGEDNNQPDISGEAPAGGHQQMRPNGAHGQGDFGGRHNRNRRRPRFGEGGREGGFRERQPRDDRQPRDIGQQPAGQPNGAVEQGGVQVAPERPANVSPDASMLPRSILGGPTGGSGEGSSSDE